jgi:hypothetical protein
MMVDKGAALPPEVGRTSREAVQWRETEHMPDWNDWHWFNAREIRAWALLQIGVCGVRVWPATPEIGSVTVGVIGREQLEQDPHNPALSLALAAHVMGAYAEVAPIAGAYVLVIPLELED